MYRDVAKGWKRFAILVLPALALAAACASSLASAVGSGRAVRGRIAAVNPNEFVGRVSNPYFPLKPGTTLRYKGEKDGKRAVDEFSVTNQAATIQGVNTTVVHDSLYLAGHLAEVTTDWYAQDRKGNVWYFGEATETLKPGGQRESTEGSWQAGVQGAQAGIFFPGSPRVGVEGQQEFFAGHAEDHFKVLSLRTKVRVPRISSTAALKTKEWTPLEPTVLDNKYYVKGIGTVLELAIKGPAERLELTSVRH
jgi:hypothetical protein